jgi:hypothetical protein
LAPGKGSSEIDRGVGDSGNVVVACNSSGGDRNDIVVLAMAGIAGTPLLFLAVCDGREEACAALAGSKDKRRQ